MDLSPRGKHVEVKSSGGTKVPNARADGSGINSEYCTHWEDIQKLMLGKAIKV